VGSARASAFAAKREALMEARALARELTATPAKLKGFGLNVNQNGVLRSAAALLALPGVDVGRLAEIWPELKGLGAEIAEQLEIDARYVGYLDRQEADIRAFRRDDALALSADLAYDRIGGLSTEVREKLRAARPGTLGAAARIPGMTPAALTALLGHVKRTQTRHSA
ncbi:MAG: tRNA uridine-5-carboxymethylaminomethyl(34) synthesis enzyme MnmG, partial [Alphaproteobacteria bacterium]